MRPRPMPPEPTPCGPALTSPGSTLPQRISSCGEPVAVEVETAGGYFAADVAFAVDSDDASNAEGGAAEPPLATDAEGVGVEAGESANSSDVSESALAASGFVLPGDVADDIETIVHVMRHGEVHNPKGILYGRLPGFQLSVTGRAQAQAVARSLADHDIALVVASPLQRPRRPRNPSRCTMIWSSAPMTI